jgi:hypothetical protein
MAWLLTPLLLLAPIQAKTQPKAEIITQAGQILQEFTNAENQGAEALGRFVGNARTFTSKGGHVLPATKDEFLRTWQKNRHHKIITELEATKTRHGLTVAFKEESTWGTHTNTIKTRESNQGLVISEITLHLPKQNPRKKPPTAPNWKSESITQAIDTYIATLDEKTPTWKLGRPRLETGPRLEAAYFALRESHADREGMGVVIRNKTTGNTAGACAWEKPGTPMTNPAGLQKQAAETLVNNSVFAQ